jgi:hypothetical protein
MRKERANHEPASKDFSAAAQANQQDMCKHCAAFALKTPS